MHSPWWRRLMADLRNHPWWPIHYRTETSSWWAWRGKYYRLRRKT